MLRQL
jgi:hypothetical protein